MADMMDAANRDSLNAAATQLKEVDFTGWDLNLVYALGQAYGIVNGLLLATNAIHNKEQGHV